MKWMGRPVHFFLRFLAFTAKRFFIYRKKGFLNATKKVGKIPQKRSAKYRKKGFFLSFLLKRRSGFFSLALENGSDYHCATTEKVGHPERAVKATLQGPSNSIGTNGKCSLPAPSHRGTMSEGTTSL